MDFVLPDPLGRHWKRTSVVLLKITLMLAQSATASAKVLGRLLPVTWKYACWPTRGVTDALKLELVEFTPLIIIGVDLLL